MKNNKVIVFDLDDTLMYEFDYLKSAYSEIATFVDQDQKEKLFENMLSQYIKGENVFENLILNYPTVVLPDLLDRYRNHFPTLVLNTEVKDVLDYCKNNNYKIGLITDGRSKTQRNKIKSLNIESYFDLIIISEEFGSEKPSLMNFEAFLAFNADDYYYIGDNVQKDFIAPNVLGWKTICLLDKGMNIHKQNFDSHSKFNPLIQIKSIVDLIQIL